MRHGQLFSFCISVAFLTAFVVAKPSLLLAEDSLTKEAKTPPPVKVAVYTGTGTGRSKQNLLKVLETFENVTVQETTAENIRAGALSDVDVLIQPGGSGSKQGKNLEETGREAIRKFVRSGGGYIGICAGAYLATSHYSWSLNILDAKVVDTRHWARGHGDVKIGVTKDGQRVLKTAESQLTILYWQGPLLAPGNRPEIEDYRACALFETEIAKNGAPKGVMKGTTAIARGQFGKGRVICFSPHPERTKGLEHLVKAAVEHVAARRATALVNPADSHTRP